LDLKTDAHFDGKSLVPLIYFGDTSIISPIYSWVTYRPLDAKMIREGDWKLIYTTASDTYELYNVKEDPGEKVNVLDRNREVAEKLARKLTSWCTHHIKQRGNRSPGGSKAKRPVKKTQKGKKAGAPAEKEIASSKKFKEPRDIAVGPDGVLYVADFGNNCIRKVSPDGKILSTIGHKGSGPANFKNPSGLYSAPDGAVFVADTWNQRIQKCSSTGGALAQYSANLFAPSGVALDRDGNIYVADTGNCKVKKLDASGKLVWERGKKGSDARSFHAPIDLVIRNDGTILVTDSRNKRIQVMSSEGKFLRSMPVPGWPDDVFNLPYIDLDAQENIYVTDPANNRVLRLDADGKLTGVLQPQRGINPLFNKPTGIAIDKEKERVFVVDTWHHCIRSFPLQQFLPE
jgi:DNA-binding beta-propeller fold protein YncE